MRPGLTNTEAEAISAAAIPPWRALFLALFETGARYEEIANLRWHAVTRSADSIAVLIERAKTAAGRRTVLVPLQAAVRCGLGGSGAPDGLVYFPEKGRAPRWSTALHHLRRAQAASGVRPGEILGTHSFRRGRISQALLAGANPLAVQAAVGHKRLTTTLKYVRMENVTAALPSAEAKPATNPAVLELAAALHIGRDKS